jgi:endonuclease/exonuclease/phosphatase family metal-dependent hydrolase
MVTMRRPGLRSAVRSALGYGRAVRALIEPHPPSGEIPVAGLGGRVLSPGAQFRVLSWNIQYCGGRGRHFFYDGGADVAADPIEVRATLAGVTALIQRWKPDLVLLQEVDRQADRTARIDQHQALAEALGLPIALSTPYHRVGWVPFPPGDHLGRADMHLSIFSAFQALRAARHNLPLLRESWARRQFNLRRAVLEIDLATTGGQPLRVFETHLSAFSYGDGSLGEQVGVCHTLASAAERNGGRWLFAGDFNALPPGDSPARLGADAALYPEAESPIRRLTDRFATVDDLGDPRWRSWIPWGSNLPDRQLDWVFHGSDVRVIAHRLDPEGGAWSDHLPLVTDLALG